MTRYSGCISDLVSIFRVNNWIDSTAVFLRVLLVFPDESQLLETLSEWPLCCARLGWRLPAALHLPQLRNTSDLHRVSYSFSILSNGHKMKMKKRNFVAVGLICFSVCHFRLSRSGLMVVQTAVSVITKQSSSCAEEGKYGQAGKDSPDSSGREKVLEVFRPVLQSSRSV